MFRMLVRRLLMLVQVFVRVFKRALCCFRRRRISASDIISPLSKIDVVSDKNNTQEQSWDEWADHSAKGPKLSVTEQQILMYRQEKQNLVKADEVPSVDFFVDMTPRIVKQKKVLLPSGKTDNALSNSLSLAPDPVFNSAELGVWEESKSWEADADLDLDVMGVVREQKRQERERRLLEQQRRKQERERQASLRTS